MQGDRQTGQSGRKGRGGRSVSHSATAVGLTRPGDRSASRRECGLQELAGTSAAGERESRRREKPQTRERRQNVIGANKRNIKKRKRWQRERERKRE